MSWEKEEAKSRHVDFQCVTSKSVTNLTEAVADPIIISQRSLSVDDSSPHFNNLPLPLPPVSMASPLGPRASVTLPIPSLRHDSDDESDVFGAVNGVHIMDLNSSLSSGNNTC